MEFLTLSMNPPEKVKPIIMRKTLSGNLGYTYRSIDLDGRFTEIFELIDIMQFSDFTQWKYIESEDYLWIKTQSH